MKSRIFLTCLLINLLQLYVNARQNPDIRNFNAGIDYLTAFKDTLNHLAENSGNDYFTMSCKSMMQVINSVKVLSRADSGFIKNMYLAFNDDKDTCNAKVINTYLKRSRPLIISWVSPTDGEVSFSWLTLPKNWQPDKKYPLYFMLHGLWSVADNPIEYLSYPYLNKGTNSFAFEDGYLLSPWGRGNYWYQGISETDIWEAMAALEAVAQIDPARKYITGHSMGGYGAWYIASKTPKTWAAMGNYAGALWFSPPDVLTSEVVQNLHSLPVYFVCGTDDALLSINQIAYSMLDSEGNHNIKFVTFPGAHDYLQVNVENMYLWMHQFVNKDWRSDIANHKDNSVDIELNIFPNPASDALVTVEYNLLSAGLVKLEIYNVEGKLVEVLLNRYQSTGSHEITWITSDISSGNYYCRLKSGNSQVVKKLGIVKK